MAVTEHYKFKELSGRELRKVFLLSLWMQQFRIILVSGIGARKDNRNNGWCKEQNEKK